MPKEPERYSVALNSEFITSYNKIDRHIRRCLGSSAADRFTSIVSAYYRKFPWMQGESDLHVFANLRNVIAHNTTNAERPLFLASEDAVKQIRALAEHLLHQKGVIPRFQRVVETISWDASLRSVLALIDARDY